LRNHNQEDPSPALVQLPFQPYESLPAMLTSAAVLIAILEPAAGVFSVPSKVYSYHCVGRPILAAIPHENLAARMIERSGGGMVVDPTDGAAFIRAAQSLLDDPEERRAMGERARAFAETAFDIGDIADRFERILAGQPAGPVRRGSGEPLRKA
jgi:colanic acid biosynthesis glycosyl transferase WcaI